MTRYILDHVLLQDYGQWSLMPCTIDAARAWLTSTPYDECKAMHRFVGAWCPWCSTTEHPVTLARRMCRFDRLDSRIADKSTALALSLLMSSIPAVSRCHASPTLHPWDEALVIRLPHLEGELQWELGMLQRLS